MPTDAAIVVIKTLIIISFVTLFLLAVQHGVVK